MVFQQMPDYRLLLCYKYFNVCT